MLRKLILFLLISSTFGLQSDLVAPLLIKSEISWRHKVGATIVWDKITHKDCKGGQVLAWVYIGPEIYLNANCRYTLQTLGTLQTIITHETGHLLGVPHNPSEKSSVMYWANDGPFLYISPSDRFSVTENPKDSYSATTMAELFKTTPAIDVNTKRFNIPLLYSYAVR